MHALYYAITTYYTLCGRRDISLCIAQRRRYRVIKIIMVLRSRGRDVRGFMALGDDFIRIGNNRTHGLFVRKLCYYNIVVAIARTCNTVVTRDAFTRRDGP